jgi:hypothetical protein
VRIPDPKTATKEKDEKFYCCSTFFCSHKDHKIKNYFIFERAKKTLWAKNLQRIIELFTQKIVIKLLEILVWYLGSEIWKNPVQDPGSRGQKGTGSQIRIRNNWW